MYRRRYQPYRRSRGLFRRSAAVTLQRRFHYRRMRRMRRPYRRTALRWRMARRIPVFYWRNRRSIRF